jgi:hypothetical protein
MHAEARRLIAELNLTPHPEGGYYRETYRSAESVTTALGAQRSALTSILFLLAGDEFSAFHSLASDETWHFYRGDPLAIEIIDPAGRYERRAIGPAGPWQTAIAAGAFFASHVERSAGYALVGCDVAPGFDFADFVLPDRATLVARFPRHAATIARFTRPAPRG